jgi:hypothetical protein
VRCRGSSVRRCGSQPDEEKGLDPPDRAYAVHDAGGRPTRMTCGSWKDSRYWLNVNREQIRQIMLNRRTQTNEPARCATPLPLLALLPQRLLFSKSSICWFVLAS